MKVIIKDGFNYVPEWNDNKKKKKDEQINVDFKFLSGADFSKVVATDSGERDLVEWLIMCDKVNNLAVNNIEITPDGVYNIPGLMDLYIELKTAYRLESVVDKKK